MKFGFVFPSHDYNIVLNEDDFQKHKLVGGKKFKDVKIRFMRDNITIFDHHNKSKKETLNNLYFMDENGEMQHVQYLNIFIED